MDATDYKWLWATTTKNAKHIMKHANDLLAIGGPTLTVTASCHFQTPGCNLVQAAKSRGQVCT
jgi:hypothetical protein